MTKRMVHFSPRCPDLSIGLRQPPKRVPLEGGRMSDVSTGCQIYADSQIQIHADNQVQIKTVDLLVQSSIFMRADIQLKF